MEDDGHLLNLTEGQVSIDEMASSKVFNKRQQNNAFLKKAKKMAELIAFEYKPYYNRPKKMHLGKIISVVRNPLNGNIY